MTNGLACYAKSVQEALGAGPQHTKPGTEYDRSALAVIIARVLAGEADNLRRRQRQSSGPRQGFPGQRKPRRPFDFLSGMRVEGFGFQQMGWAAKVHRCLHLAGAPQLPFEQTAAGVWPVQLSSGFWACQTVTHRLRQSQRKCRSCLMRAPPPARSCCWEHAGAPTSVSGQRCPFRCNQPPACVLLHEHDCPAVLFAAVQALHG